MQELLEAPEVLRAELVQQGLANIQRFYPQIMIDHYLVLYPQAAAQSSQL
jgi:hypothetical protein